MDLNYSIPTLTFLFVLKFDHQGVGYATPTYSF